MADPRGVEQRRPPTQLVWAFAILVVVVLGIWGFLDLRPPGVGNLTPLDVTYRTVRLFTLNLDLPNDATAPPQLWLAAILAPIVTARGVAALFKDQLAGVLTAHFTWPRVVVFGANPRAAALIATEDVPGWWRDAIVVVDPDPVALATITAPHVRKVTGDGTSAMSLAKAGVRRAAAVLVATGDHRRNSAIITQTLRAAPWLLRPSPWPLRRCERLLGLPPRGQMDLFVEVEGYGLAGVLEQGGRLAGVETTPFSAPTQAMESVFDSVEAERRAAGVPPLLAPGPADAPSTLAVFGTGALVDAALLELYRRRRFDLLTDGGGAGGGNADGGNDVATPAARVLLFGPDAGDRRAALAALLGTELSVLEIDAVDVELGQLVELDIETARHLARHRPRQVFVLVPSDPDNGIAVALARHLGRAERLVVVNESPTTPIGDEIVRQAADSPLMSPITLYRMPQLVYPLAALRRERRVDRLAAAQPGDGRSPDTRRAAAARMITTADADNAVVVRRDPLAELRPPHLALLEALQLTPGMAVARAGLTVDVENPATVLRAAEAMLADGSPQAFATWCEVARLQTVAAALRQDVDDVDVRDLLELRRATLGDREGLNVEAADADARTAERIIVLCAGCPDDAARAEFLRYTWKRLPPDFVAWTTATPSSAHARVAADEGVTLRTAEADGDGDPNSPIAVRRRALAIWRTIVVSGRDPAIVRVAALPGASPEAIVIARALGATVGRVETAEGGDLSRDLLGGGTDIVPLPDDRMTVRAFLRRSTWPRDLADPEPIAAGLHTRYVRRHRGGRKVAGDPVLQPWEALSEWLRDSNRAVVDDIPDKLAALGLRLAHADEDGVVDVLKVVKDNLELLAEQEHGRFTAERLTSGWTGGVRDPARFMSPHLKPWEQIDEEAKEYDREVLQDVFTAMTEAEVGAVPWTR